mmetsp:Transcript_38870/g.67230  ORF Transcript_38870/g.67230 Transcript_38870/m.67230 type:complete len:341 (+) Transcript_38870:2295-3317(+)
MGNWAPASATFCTTTLLAVPMRPWCTPLREELSETRSNMSRPPCRCRMLSDKLDSVNAGDNVMVCFFEDFLLLSPRVVKIPDIPPPPLAGVFGVPGDGAALSSCKTEGCTRDGVSTPDSVFWALRGVPFALAFATLFDFVEVLADLAEPNMAFQMPPLCCFVTGVEANSGSIAMGTTGTGGKSSTLVSNFFFVGARRGLATARSRLLLWMELPLLVLLLTLCGEAMLAFESTEVLCRSTLPPAVATGALPLASDTPLAPSGTRGTGESAPLCPAGWLLSGEVPPRGGGLDGSKLPNAAKRLVSMRFGERAGGAGGTGVEGSEGSFVADLFATASETFCPP